MKNVFFSLTVISLLMASAGESAAQSRALQEPLRAVAIKNVGDSPTVDELVSAALDHTPGLMTLKARLAASMERKTVSSSLPDPTLEVSVLGMGVDRLDPYSYVMVEYRQELPYPGKRDARTGAAEAETLLRKAELEDLKRRVTTQIRILYASLYALDREESLLYASRDLVGLLQGSTAARYRSGKGGQEDVLRAEIELARLEERLTEISSERREIVASMNRLLDPGKAVGPFRVASLPAGPLPDGPVNEKAVQGSSEMAIKRAAVRLAEKRITEARLETRPDFGVGGGLGVNAGPMPMVLLKFDVQLPVWGGSKIQPSIKASELECEAAREELRDTEQAIRAEAERLTAQYARDEALIVRYREAIAPQSRSLMEAARSQYSTGSGELSAVIGGFRSWLDAETQLARREAEKYSAWAKLQALVTPAPMQETEAMQ